MKPQTTTAWVRAPVLVRRLLAEESVGHAVRLTTRPKAG